MPSTKNKQKNRKKKKKEHFSPFSLRLNSIICSSQGTEYLFGGGGLFAIFWNFSENSSSTKASPEEGMNLEKACSCLLLPLPPVIQNAHKISSKYLYPTSHFHLNDSSQSKNLCYHYATATHSAQCLLRELFWKRRALPLQQAEQPRSSIKIHSENRTKRYKVQFSLDQWSYLKQYF